MRIVGLDLSLTSTGIAVVEDSPATIELHAVTSKGRADADLAARAGRLRLLVRKIVEPHCADADLVIVEQPAFSRTTGHHHDRSGLWWLVVSTLTGLGVDVAEVTPSSLKKYATGKGNAGKDEVLLAVARRWPHVDVRGNDEADALVLAAMGARHLGGPVDDMPKAHLTAMDAIRWPDLLDGAA